MRGFETGSSRPRCRRAVREAGSEATETAGGRETGVYGPLYLNVDLRYLVLSNVYSI